MDEIRDGITVAELARWNQQQDQALRRLEVQMEELRPDMAVLKAQLTILNGRLRVLIAVGSAVGVGLIGTAVSIALAVHR